MDDKITLAVLTWKAPQTLRACLVSLQPLFDVFDDKLIVCQEGDPREIAIADEFGLRVVAPPQNLGIQGGIKACFDNASHEVVFFCENDLHLMTSKEKARDILAFAARQLVTHKIDVAYLPYLPEFTARSVRRFRKYWRIQNGRVSPRWRAFVRPKAARLKLGQLAYEIHQHNLTQKHFTRVGDDFLLTDSSCYPHLNRALFTTKTHIGKLLAFAEANPTRRTVNGSQDLENPLNSIRNRRWFMGQKFKTLVAVPGVFGHRRYDRDDADEKWKLVTPKDAGMVESQPD